MPLAAATGSFFHESFEYSVGADQQQDFSRDGEKTTNAEKSANNEGKSANNEIDAGANIEESLDDDTANNEAGDDGSAIPTPDTRHGHTKYSIL